MPQGRFSSADVDQVGGRHFTPQDVTTEAAVTPSAKTAQNTQQTEKRAPIAGRGTALKVSDLRPTEIPRDMAVLASIPATMGMSTIPAIATMAGAAGVGKGAQSLLEGKTTGEAGEDALTDAAINAVMGSGFALAGKTLGYVAPRLKGAALRVVGDIARKFGTPAEVGQTALKYGIHPNQAGVEKAGAAIGGLTAQRGDLLSRVDASGIVPNPNYIGGRVAQRVAPDVQAEAAAGLLPDNSAVNQIQRFVGGQRNALSAQADLAERIAPLPSATGTTQNLPAPIPPTTILQGAKSKLDDAASAAYKAQQMGRRLDSSDRATQLLARESGTTLHELSRPLTQPGELNYDEINKAIMALKGAQLAAAGRAAIPASGLDDMVATYGAFTNPALTAGRVARFPMVRSVAAQGMHELAPGLTPQTGVGALEAFKAYLASLMAGEKK